MMKKFYVIVIMIFLVQVSFAQKISVPQPIAPFNEMVNTMPNATLDWTAVAGIGEITYHVQLATDDAFNNLIVDADKIDISAYYNSELLFGNQYFWRVKATDNTGTTEWSSTSTFYVFSMIEPKEPGDGDDEIPVRTMFEWEDEIEGVGDQDDVDITGGFTGIQIELDTTMTFDSPISTMIETDEVVFETMSDYILFGTTYYYRIRPFHATDAGEWSEVQEFETLFGTELKKPNNNSTDIEFDEELKWDDISDNGDNTVTDIFEYTLEVATDENFNDFVTVITQEFGVVPDFIKFGTQYWWRVKVSHVNDVSDWTDARQFTTVETVELEAPENDAVENTFRPVLEWGSLASVDGYQIILSKNSDYSNATYYIAPGENTDNYALPELDDDSDYYWSVRSYNNTDTSAWAEQRHFSIPYNVGIGEISIIEDLNIYPNPASTFINVTFNIRQSTELSWIITDVLGQNITEGTLQVQTGLFSKDISVADLNRGIYFLEIKQGDQKKVMKFMVK